MCSDNGGYIEDKSGIAEKLEQNLRDHVRIEEQNKTDHSDIKLMLGKMLNEYIPDIIVLKTKVRTVEVALLIIAPSVITLLVQAVTHWITK